MGRLSTIIQGPYKWGQKAERDLKMLLCQLCRWRKGQEPKKCRWSLDVGNGKEADCPLEPKECSPTADF